MSAARPHLRCSTDGRRALGWRCAPVFACLLLAAVPLAGCGGGEKEFSEDAFGAEAEAICTDLLASARALPFVLDANYEKAEEGDAATIETLEASFAKLVTFDDAALEEIQKLRPPDVESEAVDRLVSAFERLAAVAREDLAALRAGDLEGFSDFGARHSAGQEVVLAAVALGFDCFPPHAPPH